MTKVRHLVDMRLGGIRHRDMVNQSNDRGIYNRARFQKHPLFFKETPHFLEHGCREIMLLQRVPKQKNRGFIRNRVFSKCDPNKSAHRIAVEDRGFSPRIRQIKPLLEDLDPCVFASPRGGRPLPFLG